MTHIVADKSTPLSICLFTTISKKTKDIFVSFHRLGHESTRATLCKCRVRLSFQKLYKLAQHAETIRKNVWEKSYEAYPLSISVQTTINHISICFLPQYQSATHWREQRGTLINNGKLANQIARLAANVVKKKTPRKSLHCMLVPVQYREYQYGSLFMSVIDGMERLQPGIT